MIELSLLTLYIKWVETGLSEPSEKVVISKRPWNFLFITENPPSITKDALFLFQKLRFELDHTSLQSVVYLYHKCLAARKNADTRVDKTDIIIDGMAFLSICYHSVYH